MFFVQLLDDEVIVVLAVDINKHGFDGCIALDKRTCKALVFDLKMDEWKRKIPRVALTMM